MEAFLAFCIAYQLVSYAHQAIVYRVFEHLTDSAEYATL